MLSLAIDNTKADGRPKGYERWFRLEPHEVRAAAAEDIPYICDTCTYGYGGTCRCSPPSKDRSDNTNPNSRSSSRANTAGDDHLLPVVAGTHSLSTGATVEAEAITSQAVSASLFTRPAPFDGSGDEPSVPSFADGGAKMQDGCSCPAGRADAASGFSHAQAKQVATYSTWSPWSVCKGSI